MVFYRGIEQKDILSSLQQAETFMRALDLGPASEKLLDAWLFLDPYTKIAGAKDAAGLAQVIAETHTGGVFAEFSSVIRHHALQNLASGSGEALDLYKSLSAWDGLRGEGKTYELVGIKKEHAPWVSILKEEDDAHLIVQYAQALAGREPATVIECALAKADAIKIADHAKQAVKDILPKVLDTVRTGNISAARDMVLAGEAEAHWGFSTCLRDALQDTLGGGLPDWSLENISRFRNCGIVCSEEEFAAHRQTIENVLAPFKARGEVRQCYYGVVHVQPYGDMKKFPWGLSLRTTQEALQALAEALPELTALDCTGKRVPPSRPGPAKDAALKP